MPLIEYINKFYRGNQASFARLTGVQPAQVTQWINKDLIPGQYIMLLALEAFCLMAKRWFVSCCAAERRKPRS